MEAERFLLKWNNHQTNLVTVFDQLYEQEAFTDVTLACDGRTFAAHKVILSACSPYFQALFLGNPCKHPIIFMRDVRAGDLEALLSFMYRGEINVHQHDLSSFLKTAESLQIKGLSDSSERHKDTSKILEAMERKFCSSGLQQNQQHQHHHHQPQQQQHHHQPQQHHHQPQHHQPSLANACTAALIPTAAAVTSSESPTPPAKRFKSLDDLPRILPKMKPLSTPVPALATPVPGLLTPITLAATVMKNAAHAHAAHNARISPPNPETANSSPALDAASLPKDRKKEGYISGDSPHPVYLVSSVGGVGGVGTTAVGCAGATAMVGGITSGGSTPSHDVKVEEEDPIDDNSFSDDPAALGDNDEAGGCFGDDAGLLGIGGRDKLTYPCRYCGKRFTQTGTCRRHERLHTAPNSFKCPICQKGFNRKYRLKEHIVASHPHQSEDGDLNLIISAAATTLA